MRQSPVTSPSDPAAGGGGELCRVDVGRRDCGAPTIATVSVTCVNESVDTQRLCKKHVRYAQESYMVCTGCPRGVKEHMIIVTRVVWDR
jgi:hypothetical protein